MSTVNPRFTITLSDDLKERVDDYRFNNRISNQTRAIVSLIEKGLATFETEKAGKETTPVIEDAKAGKITVEQIEEFLTSMGLIRDDRKLSETDLKFLRAIFSMIAAWFD